MKDRKFVNRKIEEIVTEIEKDAVIKSRDFLVEGVDFKVLKTEFIDSKLNIVKTMPKDNDLTMVISFAITHHDKMINRLSSAAVKATVSDSEKTITVIGYDKVIEDFVAVIKETVEENQGFILGLSRLSSGALKAVAPTV
nr:MAG TPA: hypothetical protein [Caudoviricetes sp.]